MVLQVNLFQKLTTSAEHVVYTNCCFGFGLIFRTILVHSSADVASFWQRFTGKSLSEALIFASTNPQYDEKLFSVHENCKFRIPAEHVVYTN